MVNDEHWRGEFIAKGKKISPPVEFCLETPDGTRFNRLTGLNRIIAQNNNERLMLENKAAAA